MEKEEFIEKTTQELGGGFFAQLDAEVLWALYERWKQSPVNCAHAFYTAVHEAESAAARRNNKD